MGVTMTKDNVFEPIINKIINQDIKEFAKFLVVHECPSYFYEIGASSTGKYHPTFSIGELGLARHTCALIQFLTWILDLEYMRKKITIRQADLMIVAGLVHDWRKLGEGDNPQKYTLHTHPLLAAKMIRKYKNSFLKKEEIEFIARCVESHMGEWNTDKKNPDKSPLPKPEDEFQFLVHLADYLASRKILDMEFANWVKPELPSIDSYILEFGKHKGKTLIEIAERDKGYIDWLKENYSKEPVRSLVMRI